MYTIKKSFFYDFLPSKAMEEASLARGIPFTVSRTLIEIRDIYPPPKIEPSNSWCIKKVVTTNEVLSGKIVLPYQIAFEYVFRFLDLELCSNVVAGNRTLMDIVDYTEEESPMRFKGQNVFLEAGGGDTFCLGWIDVVRNRSVCPGDEIGLFFEKGSGFGFKVIRRGNPVQVD